MGSVNRRGSIQMMLRTLKRMPQKNQGKLNREMMKRAIIWQRTREERMHITFLCQKLGLPRKMYAQLFRERKYASEIIQELQELLEMSQQAGLNTRLVFEKAKNFEHAKQIIQQYAEQQGVAAAA